MGSLILWEALIAAWKGCQRIFSIDHFNSHRAGPEF